MKRKSNIKNIIQKTSNKLKDIDIKIQHITFLMILSKLDANNIKLDEKSDKNVLICYIGFG